MNKFEFCVLGFLFCLVLMDLVKTNYVIEDHKKKRKQEKDLERQALNLFRIQNGLPTLTHDTFKSGKSFQQTITHLRKLKDQEKQNNEKALNNHSRI